MYEPRRTAHRRAWCAARATEKRAASAEHTTEHQADTAAEKAEKMAARRARIREAKEARAVKATPPSPPLAHPVAYTALPPSIPTVCHGAYQEPTIIIIGTSIDSQA